MFDMIFAIYTEHFKGIKNQKYSWRKNGYN